MPLRSLIALGAALAIHDGAPAPAAAEEPTPAPPPSAIAAPEPGAPASAAPRRPEAPGRFFLHLNLGMNLYTHLDATGNAIKGNASLDIVPGDRMFDRRYSILQLVGFGWWFHPQFRLTLSLQFVETLTGIPDTVSRWSLFGVIAWVAWTSSTGFFVGAGPLIAPHSYGGSADGWYRLDYGVFTCVGYSLKLGKGWSLALAVQAPLLFGGADKDTGIGQRFSAGISPALALGYRL